MSEKMIFCLGDGSWESRGDGYQKNHRIFNQDATEKEYQETIDLLKENKVKISLTHWIDKKDISDEDKENYPSYKELGSCLKVFTYEEVWANFWNEASDKQKSVITDLKWFDADIFKEITGIDAAEKDAVAEEAIKLLKSKGYKIVKE